MASPSRKSRSDRRKEILAAALALCDEGAPARVTTRGVAERVGVSQPALFRHFRSREEVLCGILELVRERLGDVAERVLSEPDAREAVRSLVAGICALVREHPGIPRLLFDDLSRSGPGDRLPAFRRGIRSLTSMQRSLFSALLAREKPSSAELGGTALLSIVQGTILSWLLEDGGGGLEAGMDRALSCFFAGFERGIFKEKVGTAGGEGREDRAGTEVLLAFDAREDLERGVDPFDSIRARLRALAPEGLLLLEVPFDPAPLRRWLEIEGLRFAAEEGEEGFLLVIRGPEAPEVLDLRGLEPPEPMVRILTALQEGGPGAVLCARLPRRPNLLFPRLDERGIRHACLDLGEGRVFLHAVRPQEAGA